MFASGTYKVWTGSSAPTSGQPPVGILIVTDNGDGSTSRYYQSISGNLSFPFESEPSKTYWFVRSDDPIAKGHSVTDQTRDVDHVQPPAGHEWGDWMIELNGSTAGFAVTLEVSSNRFAAKYATADTIDLPLELSSSDLVSFQCIGTHVPKSQLDTNMDNNFPSWHAIEKLIQTW